MKRREIASQIFTLWLMCLSVFSSVLYCHWGLQNGHLDRYIYGTDSWGKVCGKNYKSVLELPQLGLPYDPFPLSFCLRESPNNPDVKDCEVSLYRNGYHVKLKTETILNRTSGEVADAVVRYSPRDERCMGWDLDLTREYTEFVARFPASNISTSELQAKIKVRLAELIARWVETSVSTVTADASTLLPTLMIAFIITVTLSLALSCKPVLKIFYVGAAGSILLLVTAKYARRLRPGLVSDAIKQATGVLFGFHKTDEQVTVPLQELVLAFWMLVMVVINAVYFFKVLKRIENIFTVRQYELATRDMVLGLMPQILLPFASVCFASAMHCCLLAVAVLITYSRWQAMREAPHDSRRISIFFSVMQSFNCLVLFVFARAIYRVSIARAVYDKLQSDVYLRPLFVRKDGNFVGTTAQTNVLRIVLSPATLVYDFFACVYQRCRGGKVKKAPPVLSLGKFNGGVHVCIGLFGDYRAKAVRRCRKFHRKLAAIVGNTRIASFVKFPTSVIAACIAHNVAKSVRLESVADSLERPIELMWLLLFCFVVTSYWCEIPTVAHHSLLFQKVEEHGRDFDFARHYRIVNPHTLLFSPFSLRGYLERGGTILLGKTRRCQVAVKSAFNQMAGRLGVGKAATARNA